jgi:hypothetical protein
MRFTPRNTADFRGLAGLAAALSGSRVKRISAMVRVRNEAEFLAAAVRSIASLVDEVVIVDNASTDASPEVIRELARELPAVRSYVYPHKVARAGREHLTAVEEGDSRSPYRLSSLSNWALRRCRCPFVLTWDGDMLAGPEFAQACRQWRAGPYLAMWFKGVNAHPDRVHLLGARSSDPKVVRAPLAREVLPGWTLRMTDAPGETRLYPRFLAHFDDALFWWCESLQSPLRFGFDLPSNMLAAHYKLAPASPLFLHLKYWKHAPNANHSEDFKAMLQGNIAVGPPLPDAWRLVAVDHGLL